MSHAPQLASVHTAADSRTAHVSGRLFQSGCFVGNDSIKC